MSYIRIPGFARSLVACAIASLPVVAVAQDSNDQGSDGADTIVVTATRFAEPASDSPTKVDVITRRQIEQSGADSVPEVLQTVGGLNVVQTGGAQFGLDSVVDMGGFGSGNAVSNTTVLLNGMRMNPVDMSNVAWGSIPINAVDRIEVQYGGSPVMYGGGATGGVINIITLDSKETINQANFSVGSFGTETMSARSAATIGQTRYDVNFSAQNSDGWRANSKTSVGSAGIRLTQDLGGGDKIYVSGTMNSSFNGMPGSILGMVGSGTPQNSRYPFDSAQNNGSQFLTGINYSLASIAKFEGEFFYNNQNSTFHNSPGTFPPSQGPFTGPYTNQVTNKWDLNFTPRFKFDLGKLGKTTVGFDYQQAQSTSNLTGAHVSNQNADVINQSFYLSQSTDLFSNLGLNLGVRRQTQRVSLLNNESGWGYDPVNQSATNSATGGEAGLNFKYTEGQRVYVRYVRSFRFANTNEFWGWDPNTYTPAFNGVLKPQTGNEVDLGGEWRLGSHKLSAMVYQLKTDNEIRYFVPSGANMNFPTITHRGVNVSDKWAATEKLAINGGITYQTQKMASGNLDNYFGPQGFNYGSVPSYNVSGVPNWLANVNGNYKIISGLSVGTLLNYVGPQYYDGDVQNAYPKMPGFFIGDLYGQYKFSDSTLRLTVKNFTDNKYASYGGYNGYGTFYYNPNNPLAVYLSYSINMK